MTWWIVENKRGCQNDLELRVCIVYRACYDMYKEMDHLNQPETPLLMSRPRADGLADWRRSSMSFCCRRILRRISPSRRLPLRPSISTLNCLSHQKTSNLVPLSYYYLHNISLVVQLIIIISCISVIKSAN